MLLRAILPLVGAAIAAPNASSTESLHNFTSSDTKSVARDISAGTFDMYNDLRTGYLDESDDADLGYLDSPDTDVASPVFWRAVLDYSHLTGSKAWDAISLEDITNVISANSYKPLLGKGDWSNAQAARWAGVSLTMAKYNNTETGPAKHWLPFATNVFDSLAKQWNVPAREITKGGISYSLEEDRSEPTGQAEWAETNTNFMLLSARLAVMTGEKKYADWADKTWDWMERAGLISASNYTVYSAVPWIPGTEFVPSAHFDLQSSNSGAAAAAAAYMYNITNGDAKWKKRVEGVVAQMKTNFFNDQGFLAERCTSWDNDTVTCPGFFAWVQAETPTLLAEVVQKAPFASDVLVPLMRSTAFAVSETCVHDSDVPCKATFLYSSFDEVEDMAVYVGAMNALNAVMVLDAGPVSNKSVKGDDGTKNGDATTNSGDAKQPSKDGSKGNNSMASVLSAPVWALVLAVGLWLL